MTKDNIIQFIKDFIVIFIIINIVEFVFYKINLVSVFSFGYILGFMIGWSIFQIIKLTIKKK